MCHGVACLRELLCGAIMADSASTIKLCFEQKILALVVQTIYFHHAGTQHILTSMNLSLTLACLLNEQSCQTQQSL